MGNAVMVKSLLSSKVFGADDEDSKGIHIFVTAICKTSELDKLRSTFFAVFKGAFC